MPYGLKIDTGLNCAFVKWRGNVGREDILSHRRALEAHPRFRPGMNRLHDCRRAAIVMTSEDARGAAQAFMRDDDRNGDYRAVMLVASEMSTGLSRLYECKRRSKNTPLRRLGCPAAGGAKIRH
ncbi:MAG: hypothetical protein QF893_12120, partial [Alphaproteobacteria bacterium]|nr:hypothetical protein [Alphaproteobacteria bacterium]